MRSNQPAHSLKNLIARAALLLALAIPLSLEAENLSFEQDTQSFVTDFDQETVEATYEFVNNGQTPVTITDSKASCGCTVPSLDKTVYQPGESGIVKAIFTIGSRIGKQQKQITVTTEEDGETKSYGLVLKVEIPIPVDLKPRVRFWTLNAAPTTQEIEITLHEKVAMHIDGIRRKDESSASSFEWEIVTNKESESYTLKVTPKASNEKARDVYYLTSKDDTKGFLRNYPIYVYIR